MQGRCGRRVEAETVRVKAAQKIKGGVVHDRVVLDAASSAIYEVKPVQLCSSREWGVRQYEER